MGGEDEEERVPLKFSTDKEGDEVPEAAIDPDVIGDLNYPAIASTWDCCPCCCCCCCFCLPSCVRPRRMGAAYLCCETKGADGTPRVKCMIGAGWTFSIATYVIMFGLPMLAYSYALPKLHWIYAVLAYIITMVGFVSLVRTSFGDPGIFPRYAAPKAKGWRFFARTKSYRPPGVIYCSENGVLVEGMDHFCPWTGTTIANKNLPFFHSFLCMLMAGLIFAMMMVALAVGSSDSLYLRGAHRTSNRVTLTRDGTLCAEIKQLNAYDCPGMTTIQEISFAEWGLPEGNCGHYKHGKCGVDAREWARERCEGMQSCELAPNHQADLGDPCFGIHKSFKLMAKCVSSVDPFLDHMVKMGIIVVTIFILVIAFAFLF